MAARIPVMRLKLCIPNLVLHYTHNSMSEDYTYQTILYTNFLFRVYTVTSVSELYGALVLPCIFSSTTVSIELWKYSC